jgi:hypothetical protein
MAAILKVDTIQDTSGNNIINENANTVTIGKAGDTVNVVGTLQNNSSALVTGKVLQVQNMTTTSKTTTTSTSFVVTSLTDTITPSATSSKILILATGNLNNTTGSQWTYATIARDGTNLGNGFGMTGVYATGDNHSACTMTFLDSPSSTSSLTYDVRIRVTGGTGNWNQQVATSSLTLIEIGA